MNFRLNIISVFGIWATTKICFSHRLPEYGAMIPGYGLLPTFGTKLTSSGEIPEYGAKIPGSGLLPTFGTMLTALEGSQVMRL